MSRKSRLAFSMRLIFRSAAFGAVAVWLLALSAVAAPAQDARQNQPGEFDFYVLSLSWSPSFCEAAGDRGKKQVQCGERPYSFVVHGFWPQYEKGFPEYCQVPSPRLDRNLVSSMLDLMPAPRHVAARMCSGGATSASRAGSYSA